MAGLMRSIASLLHIRAGEGLPLFLLLIHSFFKGIALVFFEVSANTLFLQTFDANALPYVYIATAITTVGLGFVYSRLETRISAAHLLNTTLLFLLFMLLVFYIGISQTQAPWLIMAMMVWKGVHWILLTLEFWALAGLLFNVRQGKRLFGLAASGDITAGILGGISVSFFVAYLGTINLMLISVVGVFFSWLVLRYTTQLFGHQFESSHSEAVQQPRRNLGELFKDRYLALFFIISAVSSLGYYLVDFMFYDTLETHYTDSEALASFFGLFFAILGVINLVGSTFLSGPLLTRYGLSVGLLSLPVLVIIGVILSIITASSLGTTGIFLWAIVFTKLCDEMLRTALESPTFRILYQPLPTNEQMRIQGLRESIVEPVAVGFSGVLLLIITTVFTAKAIHVAFVMLIILIAWIILAITLRQEYTVVLTNALSKRKLDGLSVSLEDGSSVEVLQKGLDSPIAGEVVYCLNTLEEVQHNALSKFLIQLLEHPEAPVRIHVLKKIEIFSVTEALEAVKQRIEAETSPQVRGTALRTLCALADVEAFEQVAPYIDNSQADIQKGAMVGLLRSGGIDGVLAAGESLNSLLISEQAKERRFSAEVLGEVGIPSFYRPLLKLLEDDDKYVRISALVASGKLKNPKLLPLILKNMRDANVREYATSALLNYQSEAIPAVEEAFYHENTPQELKIRLIRLVGRIGGTEGLILLKKNMDYASQEVRQQVFQSLVSCGYYADNEMEQERVHKLIRDEVSDTTWILATIRDIGEDEGSQLIIHALDNEVKNNHNSIFSLLSFIYPAESILQVRKDLAQHTNEKTAYSLEVLDNLLNQEIKVLIFPLFDNITATQRLSRLNTLFSQQVTSRQDRLKEIITRPHWSITAWTRACALFMVGKSPSMDLYPAITSALSSSEALLRETAVWALAQLNPHDVIERLQALRQDNSKQVRQLVVFLLDSKGLMKLPSISRLRYQAGYYREDFFINILLDDKEHKKQRAHAASVLAMLQGDHPALFSGLMIKDEYIRRAILAAMMTNFTALQRTEKMQLEKYLYEEMAAVRRMCRYAVYLSTQKTLPTLQQALNQEIYYYRARILALLILLLPTINRQQQTYTNLYYWFVSHTLSEHPEHSLVELNKVLTHCLDQDLADLVLIIFTTNDCTHIAEKAALPPSTFSLEETVEHIAFESGQWVNTWTRACAMQAIVHLNIATHSQAFSHCLTEKDQLIQETALWALAQLDSDSYQKQVRQFASHPILAPLTKQLSQTLT